ncbi:alpha/beta hydrolase [Ligilactobacillus equi]|nr:alpha/beta hydrolase [Ligilactobacillus equi]
MAIKKLSILLGMLFIGGIILAYNSVQNKINTTTYHHAKRATVFFHGYGSSSNAERHMAQAAKRAGVTKTIVEADVSENGKVTFHGIVKKDDINPIILVNYRNNRDGNEAKLTRYSKNVMLGLKKRYGISEVNLVGHSMGNMSIMYYIINEADNLRLPQVVKVVDIAGHFNGIKGMNEPANVQLNKDGTPTKKSATYQSLERIRQVKNLDKIQFLNLYGDINNQSDGRVSNTSSQSLRSLVSEKAKSYREVKFTGKKAQHSQLHENSQVDRVLIEFLWKK